jgi:hypothetical protein
MSDRSVRATPISNNNRPSRSVRAGRICKHEDCETKLSIYNPGKYCFQHEPMATPRTRGKKIA